MELEEQPIKQIRGQFNGQNGWLRTIRYGFDSCTACQQTNSNHGRLTTRGYYKHGRTLKTEHIVTAAQRMSLMIGTSLSETTEVASRGSSETHFIIEYRALTASNKGNLYVIGSIPILQAINFAVSSTGRAKEYLVPWYICRYSIAVIMRPCQG